MAIFETQLACGLVGDRACGALGPHLDGLAVVPFELDRAVGGAHLDLAVRAELVAADPLVARLPGELAHRPVTPAREEARHERSCSKP